MRSGYQVVFLSVPASQAVPEIGIIRYQMQQQELHSKEQDNCQKDSVPSLHAVFRSSPRIYFCSGFQISSPITRQRIMSMSM